MTDAELDRLTQQAIDGTLSEAEYDKLLQQAYSNGEAILSDPARIAAMMPTVFVPAPKRVPMKVKKSK